jgi:hypothetical protein
VTIPDSYIGSKLEILVFPINEVAMPASDKKVSNIDLSFGGWEDMDETTDEICSDIRASRTFRNRNFDLL